MITDLCWNAHKNTQYIYHAIYEIFYKKAIAIIYTIRKSYIFFTSVLAISCLLLWLK